jgi:hypothetical protein
MWPLTKAVAAGSYDHKSVAQGECANGAAWVLVRETHLGTALIATRMRLGLHFGCNVTPDAFSVPGELNQTHLMATTADVRIEIDD